MLHITRWAGRHPLLVRVVVLPLLFYIQGRIAFIAGANLFFTGITLPTGWVWLMVAVLMVSVYCYPAYPKEILRTAYWRVKGLECVACMVGFGLWFYAGNQMAYQFEGPLVQAGAQVVTAGRSGSDAQISRESQSDSKLKKAYRNYFRNAIRKIKKQHRPDEKPSTIRVVLNVLAVVFGVLAISIGIPVLLCGLACAYSSGVIASYVVGGLGLIILGILGLCFGFQKKRPVVYKKPDGISFN